jgi:hypothetical protein
VGTEVEQAARATSKSAISRRFVARTRETLVELMGRRLDDVRLAVLMIDGIALKERTNVVALGITTDGVKLPLGLWDGSTENATVATALLADLVDRGLDVEQGVLCVLDGSKAVRDVLGPVPVQRCVRHKERNVLEYLPERDRSPIKRRLRAAWALDDHERALDQLKRLAGELGNGESGHPLLLSYEAVGKSRPVMVSRSISTTVGRMSRHGSARTRATHSVGRPVGAAVLELSTPPRVCPTASPGRSRDSTLRRPTCAP